MNNRSVVEIEHNFYDFDVKKVLHIPRTNVISIRFSGDLKNAYLSKEDVRVLAEYVGFKVTEKRKDLV